MSITCCNLSSSSFFVNEQGDLYAWGYNRYNQLCTKESLSTSKPQQITSLSKVSQVVSGNNFSIVLQENGLVYSCGANSDGQCTGVQKQKVLNPIPFFTSEMQVIALACGANHTLALTKGKTVYGWGFNCNGELGLGNQENQTTPKCITGVSALPIKQIACGSNHSYVLTDKSLYCFGYNKTYELGFSFNTNVLTPTINESIKDIQYIAAGYSHTLALTENGTVLAWGNNGFGQLGHDNYKKFGISTIPFTEEIKGISCGCNASYAISVNGNLYSWGENQYGQLGLGHTNGQPFPTKVSLIPDKVYSLYCGFNYFIATTESGYLYGSGSNGSGQLAMEGTGKFTAIPKICSNLLDYELFSFNGKTLKRPVNPYLSDITRLWQEKMFSDITFQVENQDISAHKAFVAVRTPKILEAKSIPKSLVKVIFDYIYLDKVDISGWKLSDILFLFEFATQYCISRIIAECEAVLLHSINKNNVGDYLAAVHGSSQSKFVDWGIFFMVHNFEKVPTEQQERVPPTLFPVLLKQQKQCTIAKPVPILMSFNALAQDMGYLFESKQYSDVSLIVNGNEMQLHKCILTARCPFFAAKFRNETMQKDKMIHDTALPIKTFTAMIKYLYTGIMDFTVFDCLWILNECHYYMIDSPQLINFCEQFANGSVDVNNCVELYVTSIELKVESLTKATFNVIMENYDIIADQLNNISNQKILNNLLININKYLWKKLFNK